MAKVFLLLGSNLGNRSLNLTSAQHLIAFRAGKICNSSSIYETAPWGNTDQPGFLNQCLEIQSNHSPHELLLILQKIENEIGRIKTEKWGPRIIDIDILFYDQLILNSLTLQIPHPFLHERKFTLLPLIELNPTLFHPIFKKSVSELLSECNDKADVTKLP